jgi:alpha 1,3-glucosidase
LTWEYTPGVSATEKKEGVASVLTIKNPGVVVAKDWAVVVQI